MSNIVTLLVEDDAFQREMLAAVLKDEGFEVIECTTVRLLNSSSRQREPNCRRSSPITTWQVRCPVPP
jgi:CheY-like chemotaxis protein